MLFKKNKRHDRKPTFLGGKSRRKTPDKKGEIPDEPVSNCHDGINECKTRKTIRKKDF